MKNIKVFHKRIALFLVVVFLNQALFPAFAMALTSGPTQPEVIGFQPVGTTDMVDLFTGDFSYNIPLCEIGGYPINLSYQGDPKMDDEASWVGLGWSLNPGVINRDMRGLPDDFNGEEIEKEHNIEPNWTLGVSSSGKAEIFGIFGLQVRKGMFYNNYQGFGFERSISPFLSIGSKNNKVGTELGLGLSYSSGGGIDVSPYASITGALDRFTTLSHGANTNINSRNGLRQLTLTKSINTGAFKHGTQSNFNMGPYTYVPTARLPLGNNSIAFSASFGGAAFGAHGGAAINGYYTKQALTTNTQNQPSFGYLHLDGSNEAANVVQDYNAQQVMLRQNMPNLPLAYGTNDFYTVQAQGMSAQFRAIRNDVGIFRPALQTSVSTNLSLGVEIGVGNTVHFGADSEDITSGVSESITFIDVNNATSYSSLSGWEDLNYSLPRMPFTSNSQAYESAFFKSMGDKSVTDENYWGQIGERTAYRNQLGKFGTRVMAPDVLESSSNTVDLPNTLQRANQREIRNQVFSFLKIKEKDGCLDKNIRNYPFPDVNSSYYNTFANCEPADSDGQVKDIERDAITGAGEDQITEITVTQPDGSRYIYGIPVYNKLQKEVTFNSAEGDLTSIYPSNASSSFGLISYDPINDASTDNSQGRDHYFESTTLPPYVHSYLLTAVLPPDYVDRSGNGVSDDDSGNPVKFNYSKTDYDYNWRTPTQADMAQFHPGHLTNPVDDKASYIYGERELWYLHSVESRTMVAQFYTSEREDALGVMGEHGGANPSAPSRKLDSIRVFSKSELTANINTPDNAVPIKTIHFEYYDYNESLCQGVPNHASNGGKLTLKHVYFTHGNSQRGRLNAYHFNYNNDHNNQPIGYVTGALDRWGGIQIPTGHPDNYPFPHDFPFTIQDPNLVGQYRGAWNLKQITTPSGGEITVAYEPDDYAYVQDKRAGQMFKIEGFAHTPTWGLPMEHLTLYDGIDPKEYIIVKAPHDLVPEGEAPLDALTDEEKIELYFEDVESLYFKCLVNLKEGAEQEWISGYVDLSETADIEFVSDPAGQANFDYIFIPIKEKNIKNNFNTHPISQVAFQTMRLEIPALVYPAQNFESEDNVVEAAFQAFEGMAREVQYLLKGFEREAVNRKWAKTIVTDNSWIRLANPNHKKYGGGTRVSQVTLSDKWNFGGGESQYGQRYTYNGGVASYEPLLGGEENLMRNPMPYTDDVTLAPDNYYYTEKPFGEILYPAPIIGYSEVKVESLEYPGVERTGTGHTIYQFYTAKDFPIIARHTNIKKVRSKSNPLFSFFKISTYDNLGMSQGYVIETNDMHGKPKSVQAKDALGEEVSSTEYHYNMTPASRNGTKKVLDNEVLVINKDNEIRTASVGVDIETWQEMTEDFSRTTGVGIAANTEGFFVAIIPVLMLLPFMVSRDDLTRVNKSVTTKLVKKCGLLEKVVVTENGSTIETENVLYDEATAAVLLTKTENEYGDPIYNMTYPAHWVDEYEGMSHAYHNIGATFTGITINNDGEIEGAPFNDEDFFFPGDEVLMTEDDGTTHNAWVARMSSSGNSTLRFFDSDGFRIQPNGVVEIKIVRSGRRNQASAPIAAYEMLLNPINQAGNALDLTGDKSFISASAVTYCEEWEMNCIQEATTAANDQFLFNQTINPYVENVLGNWRAQENLVFRGPEVPGTRSVATMPPSDAVNIRDNGFLDGFVHYWEYESNNWGISNDATNSVNHTDYWQMTSKSNIIDTKGRVIESKDALDIRSSAIIGYNDNLVIAQAVNAPSKSIAFDNFEDYNFDTDCNTDVDTRRLEFFHTPSSPSMKEQITTSAEHAHSGKFSAHTSTNSIQADPLSAICNVGRSLGGDCNLLTFGDEIRNQCCHCLPQVELYNGDFFVSMWVANEESLTQGIPVVNPDINIDNEIIFEVETTFYGGGPPVIETFSPSGPVIEGWQRIEGNFSLTGSDVQSVKFRVTSPVPGIYLDDFRLHPFRSNMQSYVYDPSSLRLMATLDENNYATFYEYDDEGLLVRVKRETDQGIATIQEARTVLKPSIIQPTQQ